jgi:hypothetical protein
LSAGGHYDGEEAENQATLEAGNSPGILRKPGFIGDDTEWLASIRPFGWGVSAMTPELQDWSGSDGGPALGADVRAERDEVVARTFPQGPASCFAKRSQRDCEQTASSATHPIISSTYRLEGTDEYTLASAAPADPA